VNFDDGQLDLLPSLLDGMGLASAVLKSAALLTW
jgi:hypothetical protein